MPFFFKLKLNNKNIMEIKALIESIIVKVTLNFIIEGTKDIIVSR